MEGWGGRKHLGGMGEQAASAGVIGGLAEFLGGAGDWEDFVGSGGLAGSVQGLVGAGAIFSPLIPSANLHPPPLTSPPTDIYLAPGSSED